MSAKNIIKIVKSKKCVVIDYEMTKSKNKVYIAKKKYQDPWSYGLNPGRNQLDRADPLLILLPPWPFRNTLTGIG